MRYLPALVLGRPLHGAERYRPFFIVGSGRCGTTLLRAMLEAHTDVHIPPETHVLGRIVRTYRLYSRLPWDTVLGIVLSQFEYRPAWEEFELTLGPVFQELITGPRRARNLAAVLDALYRAHASKHKPSATRWGDKTPLNVLVLPQLQAVFPDLRVVHVLRDGRDVVGSYLQLDPHSLSFFAEKWLRTVTAARAFAAGTRDQFLEVRYENLVREPRQILERVATFLGLPFEERMLHHHDLDLWLRDIDRFPHMRGPREPVYQSSIGRWRRDFDQGQVAELERTLGPTLVTLGYPMEGEAIGRPS